MLARQRISCITNPIIESNARYIPRGGGGAKGGYSEPMAGRKARMFTLCPEDKPVLSRLLRQARTEQRVARRARILLEMDRGVSVGRLADMVDMDPATVWRICRRYETRGLEAVFDAPRPGRRRRLRAEATARC